MRTTTLAAFATALTAIATGCGATSHSAVRVQAATSDSTSVSASPDTSPEWLSAGNDIVANRAANAQRRAAGQSVPPDDTFGPYLSQPLNVTGNGEYSIVIGPLRDGDANATLVQGISGPNVAKSFELTVGHMLTTYQGADGKIYGKLTATVSNFSAEADGLTFWTQ